MKSISYWIVLILLFSGALSAKTTRSNGGGTWSSAGTWDNGVPVAGDEVFIENGDNVTLTSTTSVANVYIVGNGSTLTINSGVILYVSQYFYMRPTGNSQTNTLLNNGTLYCGKGMTPRTESGRTGYTANITGTGFIQLVQDIYNMTLANGSMTVNFGNKLECRDMYNYTTGASSSMVFNLTDSIRVKRNIILQAQVVTASGLEVNMDNASAKLRLDGSFDFRNNGGTISQGTAESIFYFGNLANYSTNANISYRNISFETQTLSSAVNITNLDNSFIIPAGKTLSGSGSVTLSEGNLTCNGGTMSPTVSLGGSSAQTITVNTDTDIPILDISNTSGGVSVSGSGNLNITQGITFTTAAATTFNTGGKVTLKDNGSGMAYLGNTNSHTVSGNLTCEFRTQTLSNIEYRMLSMPVAGVTLGAVDYDSSSCSTCMYSYGYTGSNKASAGGFVSSYTYNTSAANASNSFNDGWTASTSSGNSLAAGSPVTWYIGPGVGSFARSSYEVDVTGTANAGPFVVSGFSFDASGGSERNWALVGNPFPSSIDFSAVTQNNVDKDPYIFKADNGGYALDNTIPPFQAFFVKTTGSSPSLTFNESSKVTTQKVYQKNFKDDDEIQIKLSTPLYPNQFNYTYLRFNNGASLDYDAGVDKDQLRNPFPYPNVSLKTADNKNTYRNVINSEIDHVVIPLNAHGYVSGNYELSFANLSMVDGCVILEDTYTNTSKGLTASDSTYSFSLSDTTTGARFVLHIYNLVDEVAVNNSSCFGDNNGSATLKLHSHGDYYTSWFDESNNFVGGNINVKNEETVENLKPGNYRITVESGNLNCPSSEEYFTIHEPSEMKANFGFANQLLSFRTDKEIEFKNLSEGGIANYLWDFGDNSFSTEQNPKHVYSIAGVYDIQLTAGNGNEDCNVNYKQSIEVAEATGLAELSTSTAYELVQQNGKFFIHFNKPAVTELQYAVYDVQGRTINKGNIAQGSLVEEIEVGGEGIVFINLNCNAESETIKVLH